VSQAELSDEERSELAELKSGYINEQYDYLLEATLRTSSITDHFHLHLMVIKDFEV
jgi:hypothetical protein